jgi:hypothetical protein
VTTIVSSDFANQLLQEWIIFMDGYEQSKTIIDRKRDNRRDLNLHKY